MTVYLTFFAFSYELNKGIYATPNEGSAHCSSAVLVQHGVADVQTICWRQAQETRTYYNI